ncbi:hypothetical protein [Roseimaritima sediminicola]|uniref:hypothetical protein n=1 Tax=Roseimaritima sediminicola TaxID=2662066 RepID=UPI001F27693F|nr:hypothetical protein [Roseimaritima sediminicola]
MTGRGKGLAMLLLWSAAIAVVWLVVLPYRARQPAMREHLQWLDDKGIDPSAMYYTELEVMEEILQRQRQARRAASGTRTAE